MDEAVEQKLRVLAANHGRTMEAEAREILISAVRAKEQETTAATAPPALSAKGKFDHMIGIWEGRGTTDELMRELRGED